jgi:D-alanyl-D-alanine dipeptidase
LIGEYGTVDDMLLIYEEGGMLYAHGRGLQSARLSRLAANRFRAVTEGKSPVELVFDESSGPHATHVSLKGARLDRHDFGAEVEAQVRAGVHARTEELRAAALSATPPREPAPKRAADLVSLTSIDPTIKLDIRYAGTNNFMGIRIYECAAAFLQRPAAEAVGRVHRSLRARGLGVLIHDAYRPWYATKMFWDATPESNRMFVADPSQGSRHNRGCAVDLTLYELESGRAVEMPGRYDEFSVRSYPDFRGGTSRQRWFRDLLRREMEREGFTVYPQEWWHFDFKDWRDYGINNFTFSELAAELGLKEVCRS